MNNKMSVAGIIGSVIFFLSFLPYFHIVYIGFTGMIFGLQGVAVFYGYLGMLGDAFFLTLCGVLPVCFFYQLVVGIRHIRHHNTLHKTTIILIVVLIIAGLLTEPVAGMIHGTTAETDPVKIQEFSSQKHWPW